MTCCGLHNALESRNSAYDGGYERDGENLNKCIELLVVTNWLGYQVPTPSKIL
jgi:hypothetical protein